MLRSIPYVVLISLLQALSPAISAKAKRERPQRLHESVRGSPPRPQRSYAEEDRRRLLGIASDREVHQGSEQRCPEIVSFAGS